MGVDPVENDGIAWGNAVESGTMEFVGIIPSLLIPAEAGDPLPRRSPRSFFFDQSQTLCGRTGSPQIDPFGHLSRTDQMAVCVDEAGEDPCLRRQRHLLSVQKESTRFRGIDRYDFVTFHIDFHGGSYEDRGYGIEREGGTDIPSPFLLSPAATDVRVIPHSRNPPALPYVCV